MPQVDDNPTPPTATPGGTSRAQAEQPAALFLPPGPQDIRINQQDGDTPPAMMADPGGAVPPLPPVMEDDDVPEPCPTDVMIGEAGVHLVLSRLLRWGIHAQAAGPGRPYNVIAHGRRGVGLVCLQVKTTAQPPHGRRYRFRLTRGFHRSARGVFAYQPGDFDIAAFVVLEHELVLFRPFGGPAFAATPAEFCTPQADRQSFRLALAAVEAQRWTPPAGGVRAAPPV